jgi:hypothetical protein
VREVVQVEVLVGVGYVGVAFVERFLDRAGVGAEQSGLQQLTDVDAERERSAQELLGLFEPVVEVSQLGALLLGE